jgi:hypothetical protein
MFQGYSLKVEHVHRKSVAVDEAIIVKLCICGTTDRSNDATNRSTVHKTESHHPIVVMSQCVSPNVHHEQSEVVARYEREYVQLHRLH